MQWYYGFDFGADTVRMVTALTDEIRVEAAWAAFRRDADAPFAWGDRAYSYLGRQSAGITLRQAMRAGIPTDPKLLGKWMSRLVLSDEKRVLARRRALALVSPSISEGMGETLMSAALDAGMDVMGIAASDTAAALGCGLDVMGPEGCFLLDIGAEHMSFSAMAGGRRVLSRRIGYGMARADEAIREAVRQKEGVIVSERVARILKHAAFQDADRELTLPVFDPVSRLPKYMLLKPALAQDSLNEVVAGILEMCFGAVNALTPSLAEDLEKNGLTLTGGGSLLGGLAECLQSALGVPVKAADDPQEAAARGLKMILDDSELYSPLINDWREAGLRL